MQYIPVQQHWLDMFRQYDFYEIAKKFPIEKIGLKKLRNELNTSQVLEMLMNFNGDAWIPITLDKNYVLADGQHRLALARRLGLEFIDAVILTNPKYF